MNDHTPEQITERPTAAVDALPNYAVACATAASNQGLDPLIDGLTIADVPHDVEQTGGFCMVVTRTTERGTLAAVCDGDPEAADYLTIWYPGDAWNNGQEHTETAQRGYVHDAIARFEALTD